MFYRYPTCYSISKTIFRLQIYAGNVYFQLFSEQSPNIRISLNLNEFTSNSDIFIQKTCLFLIKIVTTMHPFKMILTFMDTLHVTLFKKNIFICNLTLVVLIFNLFLKCVQIIYDFFGCQSVCFKFAEFILNEPAF